MTAAHCVQDKNEMYERKPEESTFYIGKHNLEALGGESGFVYSGVAQLIVHPSWNHTDDRYDADIAIAVLVRTVTFNRFVKPICLWQETTDFQDLIGKKGVVAGWGKTELAVLSTVTPKWIEIPVVSDSECLRSKMVFSQLTSNRTFCGGDLTGHRGPCSGDSGKFIIHITLNDFLTFQLPRWRFYCQKQY